MPILSSLAEAGPKRINIQDLAVPNLERVRSLLSVVSTEDWETILSMLSKDGVSHAVFASANIIAQATGYSLESVSPPSFEAFERTQMNWYRKNREEEDLLQPNADVMASNFANYRQVYGRKMKDLAPEINQYYWFKISNELERKRNGINHYQPNVLAMTAGFNIAFPQDDGMLLYGYTEMDKPHLKLQVPYDDIVKHVNWLANYRLLFTDNDLVSQTVIDMCIKRLGEYAQLGKWVMYAYLAKDLAILLSDDARITQDGVKLYFDHAPQITKVDDPPPTRSF